MPQPFEGETCPYIENLPDECHWDRHGKFQSRHVESQVAWHSYPFTPKRVRLQEELASLSRDRVSALEGISILVDLKGYGLRGWGHGGWAGFLAIFDQFEEDMIGIVLGGKRMSTVIKEVGKRRMEEEIWGDSDEEEEGPPYPR